MEYDHVRMGTNLSRRESWEDGLDAQRAVLERMLVNQEQERDEVEATLAAVPQNADPETHPAFEAYVDTDAFLNHVYDIVLVATYHWVERELKALCRWTFVANDQPEETAEKIRQWSFQKVEGGFGKYGIALAALADYRIVNVLREFANSWKHNGDVISEPLCRLLGLECPESCDSHVGTKAVRDAMCELVSPGQPERAITVVRLFIERAERFLRAVVAAAPDWPPLE